MNKFRFAMYRIFHSQNAFNKFNANNIIYSFDKYHIVSCVIKRHTRVKNLIRFILQHKDEKCYLVLMFHSVVPKPKNEWEWKQKYFETFCTELESLVNKGEIENINLRELVEKQI